MVVNGCLASALDSHQNHGVVLPLLGAVAYLTLWERKLIGWIQIRLGPNRVGPLGLLAADRRCVEVVNQRNFGASCCK